MRDGMAIRGPIRRDVLSLSSLTGCTNTGVDRETGGLSSEAQKGHAMGSSPKTLERLKHLTTMGALLPGSSVCDIGATQLFGDKDQQASRAFLSFYADRFPGAKRPEDVPPEALQKIAQDGFLGDLLILAGFEYKALDIFHATNTILFDLNIHEPGPDLIARFDLVINLGTTEHVFNQLRAFQTIHTLTKINGVCYHDLPMAGYLNHALYRYDPLFFSTVLPANRYALLLQEVTLGAEHAVPDALKAMGYKNANFTDVGIEVIYRRVSSDPFRVPMETSTSLSVDPAFDKVAQSDLVRIPSNANVHYGTSLSFDSVSFADLTLVWFSRLAQGLRRRIIRH
jgi:hypothetical protein